MAPYFFLLSLLSSSIMTSLFVCGEMTMGYSKSDSYALSGLTQFSSTIFEYFAISLSDICFSTASGLSAEKNSWPRFAATKYQTQEKKATTYF